MMHRPLTSEEQERIAAAVAATEKRSGANFAVSVVKVSDRYRLYAPLWGAVLAIVGLGALALLRPALSIGTGFIVAASLFVVLTLVLDWLPLRLAIVPKRVKHRRADQLAHRHFAASILANAQQREGVLYFVSLGEHFVEVLASRGVHSVMPEGSWDRIAADLVAAVKAGHLADGLVAAVETCGGDLEPHASLFKGPNGGAGGPAPR